MNILTTTKEKEIEFRDEIIYKEVITHFKDFPVKKYSNPDISENQKGERNEKSGFGIKRLFPAGIFYATGRGR